jgi:hypothetical protein
MPARGKRPALRPALILLCLALAPGAARAQSPAPADLAAYLPAVGRVPGWQPDGDIQRYAGEDLFVYIDGGAEIYREYGFRRVVARDYRNAAGKSVTLEIFEMTDPLAAYGVFSFKASGRGRRIPVGQAADLEDYYLNIWKGACQVTVTGFDESPDCLAGVRAVGEAATDLIPAAGSPPELFDRLPEAFAASGHRKLLKGVIGLYNIHPFFAGDVLRFAQAAAAEAGGEWAFLFRYATEDEAAARLPEVRKALETAGRAKDITLSPAGTLTAIDDKGLGQAWRQKGRDIIAVLTGAGPDVARSLLDRFR